MSEPPIAEPAKHAESGGPRECDDTPKLTADEWAYVQAVTDGEQTSEGGDS